MPNIESLPYGQINAAAKPVDAFISPVNYQNAQPSQPQGLPSPKGASMVGTSGTPNVQGYNSFEQLAVALKPFSEQLVKTAQTAGLQYAAWQMDRGEAQAMEAFRRAQVNVDLSSEIAEKDHAHSNRALAIKDPQAGWLMHILNPYARMGVERGNSKLAGQEIAMGMAGYVAKQSSRIDYNSPDQGFSALSVIRSEYISEVTKKYGVNENSPGFQAYTAPKIERASESVAQKVQEDRTKFYDEMKPRQLAALLSNEMSVILKDKKFEYRGVAYTTAQFGKDLSPFYYLMGKKLNDMQRDYLQSAGLPGAASKWTREAYEIMSADAEFRDNPGARKALGVLQSSEPLRGFDGKPAKDPDGNDIYLSWDQLYSKETIDSKIKYQQAGYASRNGQMKDIGQRAAGVISMAIEDMPPGPGRMEAGKRALDGFVQAEQQRLGRRLNPTEIYQIRKDFKEALELNSDLVFELDDPRVEVSYMGQLGQKYGSDFDGRKERAQVQALAATIRDPKRAQQFLVQANGEIRRKEIEAQGFSRYSGPRDKIVNDNIKARLQRNYEIGSGATDYTKPDRVESERRQRFAYVNHVNTRLKEAEARNKGPLSDTQVRSITQEAIDDYGSKDKSQVEYLFPGSAAYPQSKSVDPYGTIKPIQLGPDGKPKVTTTPMPRVYDLKELDDIPNRSVELRQYQSKPVLSLGVIRDALLGTIDGKPMSMKLERAWRDAGAPNAYQFFQDQLKFYPNYRPEWTPGELNKARKRLTSSVTVTNANQGLVSMAPQHPKLSMIGGRFLDVLTGASVG